MWGSLLPRATQPFTSLQTVGRLIRGGGFLSALGRPHTTTTSLTFPLSESASWAFNLVFFTGRSVPSRRESTRCAGNHTLERRTWKIVVVGRVLRARHELGGEQRQLLRNSYRSFLEKGAPTRWFTCPVIPQRTFRLSPKALLFVGGRGHYCRDRATQGQGRPQQGSSEAQGHRGSDLSSVARVGVRQHMLRSTRLIL